MQVPDSVMFWNNTPRSIADATLGRVVGIREGTDLVAIAHIKGFDNVQGVLCLQIMGSDKIRRTVFFEQVELL